MSIKNEYCPDYVPPPGETLAEILYDKLMTPAQLAKNMNVSKNAVTDIIDRKGAITIEIAQKLEHTFGIPREFWVNLEKSYRRHLYRRHLTGQRKE